MKWQKENREKRNETCRLIVKKRDKMVNNKTCSAYLGIHVAERVLSQTFKDVEVMPTNNPGYDFICNKGKKIDVKSACRNSDGRWVFAIRRNTVPDYFLFLAFDNRENLNPLYMWLVPSKCCDTVSTSITQSTISKWKNFERDVGKVKECCGILKDE